MHLQFRAQYLAVTSLFISTEETRYYLNGVCIQPCASGGLLMIATDGHRLALMRDPDGTAEGLPAEGVIFKAPDAILKLCAKPPAAFRKHYRDDGEHLTRWVCRYDGKTLTVGHRADNIPDLLDATSASVKPIDGTFPDWRRLIGHDDRGYTRKAGEEWTGFNPGYIADFCKAARMLDKDATLAVISAQSDNAPAIIKVSGQPDFYGLCMHKRAGGLDNGTPAWASEYPKGDAKAA